MIRLGRFTLFSGPSFSPTLQIPLLKPLKFVPDQFFPNLQLQIPRQSSDTLPMFCEATPAKMPGDGATGLSRGAFSSPPSRAFEGRGLFPVSLRLIEAHGFLGPYQVPSEPLANPCSLSSPQTRRLSPSRSVFASPGTLNPFRATSPFYGSRSAPHHNFLA